MPVEPDVSLIVTTYQRPQNLEKVLASVEMQDFTGRFDVVVADDGSSDNTRDVVNDFAARVSFPVRFTSHPHAGFHVARTRNDGATAGCGQYLIFLDGDCVTLPNHITRHMEYRRHGSAVVGYCCRLADQVSSALGVEAIRALRHQQFVAKRDYRGLTAMDRKARFYRLIGHPTKPRLRSGNFGMWREDYELINGFDENYVGWGCEDDDFGMRLRRAGIRIRYACRKIPTLHLWHPPALSSPERWSDGNNVEYLHRTCRLTRCLHGMNRRRISDLSIKFVGDRQRILQCRNLFAPLRITGDHDTRPDFEVLVLPGNGKFSGRADCNVLLVSSALPSLPKIAGKAHLLLADWNYADARIAYQFRPNQFQTALRFLIGLDADSVPKCA